MVVDFLEKKTWAGRAWKKAPRHLFRVLCVDPWPGDAAAHHPERLSGHRREYDLGEAGLGCEDSFKGKLKACYI